MRKGLPRSGAVALDHHSLSSGEHKSDWQYLIGIVIADVHVPFGLVAKSAYTLLEGQQDPIRQ